MAPGYDYSVPIHYLVSSESRRTQRNRDEQRRQGNFYAFGARTGNDAQLAGWGLPDPGHADDLVEHRPGGLAPPGDHDGGYHDGHQVPGAAVDVADAFADAVPEHLAIALSVGVSVGVSDPFRISDSYRLSGHFSLCGRPEQRPQ
ncbi:MAG TPA: hypothetical protein VHO07_31640 [Streptosporangiaceae bacterium]|nr:hypothetical protein [Streptosporangiaceae bacterium]